MTPFTRAPLPKTVTEMQEWVRQNLALPRAQESELLATVEEVILHQQQLWQASKEEAIQALCEGFARKAAALQAELSAKDATVSNVAKYFEKLVVDLNERARRDAKTKLMNFDWFMERLESYLAVEQRARWCGVGVVDITGFKWYNDNLGHAVGDLIIQRVAGILSEQIRTEDLLAQEAITPGRNLHARFGGDEFCFLIPDLRGHDAALIIADRFKAAVEAYDWKREDDRLHRKPVQVDVGVVCLRLGPLAERRGAARKLAADLIRLADKLMYGAKGNRSTHVHPVSARIDRGQLVELPTRSRVLPYQRQARG